MKKGIIIAVTVLIVSVFIITREEYNPTIHEENLQKFASKTRFQDLN